MKAKAIKKIRSRAQLYYVSDDICDRYFHTRTGSGIVLAFNPMQAINKLRKRNHQIKRYYDQCDKGDTFLKYRVQPVNKPFERFKTYWS